MAKRTLVYDFKNVKFVFNELIQNEDAYADRISRLESLTDYLAGELEKMKQIKEKERKAENAKAKS